MEDMIKKSFQELVLRGLEEGKPTTSILQELRTLNNYSKTQIKETEILQIIQETTQDYKSAPHAQPFITKTGQGFNPALLAKKLLETDKYLCTPIDSTGSGIELLIYKNGYFQQGGASIARTEIVKALGDFVTEKKIADTIDILKEITKTPESVLNCQSDTYINTKNGMVNWRTGSHVPHSPDYKSTYQINAKYDTTAYSSEVDKFLKEVFPKDSIELVEELLGYLLVPNCKYQKAFMLNGSGSNGKSTFLEALRAFIGRDNCSSTSLQEISNKQFGAASLEGKLVNIHNDLPNSIIIESDKFKSIVCGETITVERKYVQPYQINIYARLLFSTNELPKALDDSNGWYRRWIVIPFDSIFQDGKEDPDMLSKLTTESARSHLLNLAIKGLRRLTINKQFTLSKTVESATLSYKNDTDNVREFLIERVKVSETESISKTFLYNCYRKWCSANDKKPIASNIKFHRKLQDMFPHIKEDKHGVRTWKGITYTNEDSNIVQELN